MTDSLRDQLLGLGFKSVPKPARTPDNKPQTRPPQQQPHRPRTAQGPRQPAKSLMGPNGRPGAARTREDIDLAKAYAIRAQREKDERIETERQKQEDARKRREAKAQLAELLKDKALNDPAAEIARHFDYGGKIKRVYVNAAQLKALNAGHLGLVQLDGRYVLVEADLLTQVEAIFAPAVALKINPDATTEDPYADPQFRVPDDLVW
jgi:uncharacterized protein YaiL (DUF2058 family)